MNQGTFSQRDIQVDGQMLSKLTITPQPQSPPPPPPASRPSVSFLDDAQHNTDMDHGDRREDTYEPGEIGSRSANPAPKRKRTSRGKGRRRKRANGQSGPNVPGEPSRPGDQSRPRERSRPREQSPIRNRSQYWSPSINTRSPRDMHSGVSRRELPSRGRQERDWQPRSRPPSPRYRPMGYGDQRVRDSRARSRSQSPRRQSSGYHQYRNPRETYR
ncbi:uncharacterized protein F4817DRAFT_338919 [Daldinia loculata]|uniref:uncharacterized protein n=1 Tax=Daldinia loculata TaxID=103429 RepID=UPI0020C3EA21|nr:uncharacterized protein F4817DRAFT_338919 [Daldinia loculata]KAI1646956.1 hypothetical protein F4817DRAFT_338919 [Daldinia loculata]